MTFSEEGTPAMQNQNPTNTNSSLSPDKSARSLRNPVHEIKVEGNMSYLSSPGDF